MSEESKNEFEQFAYSYSHNLKGSLRLITNFVQLLSAHNSKNFDNDSQEYIQHIFKNIYYMDELIKSILLYSNITSSQEKYCEIDLNKILHAVKNEMLYRLQETKGILRIDGLLPTIYGDPSHVYHLFFKLIDNAIKFRSQEPLQINITCKDQKKYWEIIIKDNGIGIDEQYHKSIFDLFLSLNSKNIFEGSGVGLSICQKIVEKHGGTISVRSNPTGGCTFKILIKKILS